MSCRATSKLTHSTTASNTLQHLWISDDLLSEAFHRFLRVSRTSRRYGSNVPGPLEARRRLAKRGLGVTSAATGTGSGAAPPGHYDFAGLFGRPPPPELDKGWRWQAPVSLPVSAPPPSSVVQRQVDGWAWPLADETVEQSNVAEDHQKERVEQFLRVPDDPVETSRKVFEELLEARQSKTLLAPDDIRPLLEFLQSSTNEPHAKLTFHLLQWLAHRDITAEASQALTSLIGQKITLRTISEKEESGLFLHLLHREDASALIPNILDSIQPSNIRAVLHRTTIAILDDASVDSGEKVPLISSWLACLRATKCLLGHSAESNWDGVYEPLSRRFRPSDFADHFYSVEPDVFVKALLRYWIPDLLLRGPANAIMERKEEEEQHSKPSESIAMSASSSMPSPAVNWESLWSAYQDLRSSIEQLDLPPRYALVDLISVLARYNLRYSLILHDLFTLWRKTESSLTIVDLIRQLRNDNPPIYIPNYLALSLVQFSMRTGDLSLAIGVFYQVPTLSLSDCRELPLKLIETGGINSNRIWNFIDHWARKSNLSFNERKVRQQASLSQDVIDLVHEVAYAWAKFPPKGRVRVAWRRVEECYRFLWDSNSPLSPLMSRALVRAGVVNFVRERKPVPQTRVQFLLDLVGEIEGEEVRREVDRMIFEYWRANKKFTRYQAAGPAARAKFLGEQVLEDGTVRNVRWRSRILRKAAEMKQRQKERGLDVADDAWVGEGQLRARGSPKGERGALETPVTQIEVGEVEESNSSIETYQAMDITTEESEPAPRVVESESPKAKAAQSVGSSVFELQEMAQMALERRGLSDSETTPSQTAEWASFDPLETADVDADGGVSAAYRPYGSVDESVGEDVVGFSSSDVSVRAATPSLHSDVFGWSPGEVEAESLEAAPKQVSTMDLDLESSETQQQDFVGEYIPFSEISGLGGDDGWQDSLQSSLARSEPGSSQLELFQPSPCAESEQVSKEHTSEETEYSGISHTDMEALAADIQALRVKKAKLQKRNDELQPTRTAIRKVYVTVHKHHTSKETEYSNLSHTDMKALAAEITALRIENAKLQQENLELQQNGDAMWKIDETISEHRERVVEMDRGLTALPSASTLLPRVDQMHGFEAEAQMGSSPTSVTSELVESKSGPSKSFTISYHPALRSAAADEVLSAIAPSPRSGPGKLQPRTATFATTST